MASPKQPSIEQMRQSLQKKAGGGSAWKSPEWKPHPENDLLQPIGASNMVGDEKLISQDDTFSHGLSEFPSSKKSYRYLYHGDDQQPIGSMQIQTSGPRSKKAVIQNLYVAEANRRKGIASKLLQRARQDFDVKHSTDLTSAGKAFAKAVKANGGLVQHKAQGGAVEHQNPLNAPLRVPMTKKRQYPQSEALELARLNAIRLLGLHEHNTPEERARAMGFVTAPSKQEYHGARGELLGDVNPAKSDLGFHTGTPEQANQRLKAFAIRPQDYPEGANILPLMVSRYANLIPLKDTGSFHADSVALQLAKKKLMDTVKARRIVKDIDENWNKREAYDQQMRDILAQHGYHGGKYQNEQEGSGQSKVFTDPSVLRSRFAAFDPARAHEAGLSYADGGSAKTKPDLGYQSPSVAQMREEMRNFNPIANARQSLASAWEKAKAIPGNIQRLATDPAQYVRSLPAPTEEQLMNALSSGNIGMAGIMIGPKAKTWSTPNAAKAEAMEAAGHPPEKIWQETGTYRGPDGAWRQEINDQPAQFQFRGDILSKAKSAKSEIDAMKAQIKESLEREKEGTRDLFPKDAVAARKAVKAQADIKDKRLSSLYGLESDPTYTGNYLKHAYEHPELYAAYPELQGYVMRQGVDAGPSALGSLEGQNVNVFKYGLTKNPKSTVAHEMQHAIQALEDTPRGSSPNEFWNARQEARNRVIEHNQTLSDLSDKITKAVDPEQRAALKTEYAETMAARDKMTPYARTDPYLEYERMGGEAESRMVQNRLEMSPEERAATYPMKSYGDYESSGLPVDPKDLILITDKAQIQPGYAAGGTTRLAKGDSTGDLDTMKLALIMKQRDANKAKFLKGSKAKERVYHGTGNLENLASFDPALTGKGTDQLGSGFYFTTDPDEASGYANAITQNAPLGANKLGGQESPGVVAAHLAIKKPLVVKGHNLNDTNVKLQHHQALALIKRAPNIEHPDESPLNDWVDTSRTGITPKVLHDVAQHYTGPSLVSLGHDFFHDDPTAFRTAIRDVLGYDGVMQDFGGGRKHYVAWFPEQVKSAIGNRGTYDPNEPDITKAEGGIIKDYLTLTERQL